MQVSAEHIHFAKNVKGHDVWDVCRGVSHAAPEADGRPHPGWWLPAGLVPSVRNLRDDGGPGDAVAIGTSDLPSAPAVGRVAVFVQHGKYTHLGVVVSGDLLAPEASTFNRYYRWVRVIAMGDAHHQLSSALVMDPVDAAKWSWFNVGGDYCEIARARPLRGPASRRAWQRAVWAGFGLAESVVVDASAVTLPLGAAHAP